MTDPSQSSPDQMFVRARFVELRTAACMVDLKKRLPEEWVGVVEPAVRELMVFEDVFSSSMSTREVRDESICAVCAEMFGEQFLIRVGLERASLPSQHGLLAKCVRQVVEEILFEKLSTIQPESVRRGVVREIMLTVGVSSTLMRCSGWLIRNKQTNNSNRR